MHGNAREKMHVVAPRAQELPSGDVKEAHGAGLDPAPLLHHLQLPSLRLYLPFHQQSEHWGGEVGHKRVERHRLRQKKIAPEASKYHASLAPSPARVPPQEQGS